MVFMGVIATKVHIADIHIYLSLDTHKEMHLALYLAKE